MDCFGVQSVDTIGRCSTYYLLDWQGQRVCDARFCPYLCSFKESDPDPEPRYRYMPNQTQNQKRQVLEKENGFLISSTCES
jgi:hypothetical protein